MENYEDDESLKQTEDDGAVEEETNELIVPEIETEEIDLPFESFYFTTNSEGDNFYYDFNAELRPITLCERYRLQIVEVQFCMTAWQINEDDYLKIQIQRNQEANVEVLNIKPTFNHLNTQLTYLLKDLTLCFADNYDEELSFEIGSNGIFTLIRNNSDDSFTITILEMTNNFEILMSMPYFTEKISTTPFPPIVIEADSTYRFIRPWNLVNGDVIFLTATSLDHPLAHFKKFNNWNQRVCVSRFFNGSTEQGYSISLSSQQASSVVSFTALNSIHFQLLRIDGSFLKIQTPMIFEVQITPIQTFITRSFLASNLTNSLMKRDKALNINNNFFTRGGRKVNEKLKTTLVELQNEQNTALGQLEQKEELIDQQHRSIEEFIRAQVSEYSEERAILDEEYNKDVEKYREVIDETLNTRYKKAVVYLEKTNLDLEEKKKITIKEKEKSRVEKKITRNNQQKEALKQNIQREKIKQKIKKYRQKSAELQATTSVADGKGMEDLVYVIGGMDKYREKIERLEKDLETFKVFSPKTIDYDILENVQATKRLEKKIKQSWGTLSPEGQTSCKNELSKVMREMKELKYHKTLMTRINKPLERTIMEKKILEGAYKIKQEELDKKYIDQIATIKSESNDNENLLRVTDLSNNYTTPNLLGNSLYHTTSIKKEMTSPSPFIPEMNSIARKAFQSVRREGTPIEAAIQEILKALNIKSEVIRSPSRPLFERTFQKPIVRSSRDENDFMMAMSRGDSSNQADFKNYDDISTTMPSDYDMNNVNNLPSPTSHPYGDISLTMPPGHILKPPD